MSQGTLDFSAPSAIVSETAEEVRACEAKVAALAAKVEFYRDDHSSRAYYARALAREKDDLEHLRWLLAQLREADA